MAILLAILFLPLLAVDLCTASIVSPPTPKEDPVGSLAHNQLVESCGRCHLLLPGGHSAELFTFEDGPERRFLFVQNDGFLHILDRKRSGELATELEKFEEIETRRNGAEIRLKTIAAAKKKPPTAADGRKPNEKGPSYRRQDRRQIASSGGKYPPVACQLQKLRPVPTADLYRSKYASARLAHVGFVPANPDQWWNGEQQLNMQHKWWWYFALRLDNAKCLLARLPTGAARINLDLGVRLVENARALHVCPLASNGNERQQQQQAEQAEFGCVEPHVFLLVNQQDGNGSSVPMELGFSYQLRGKEGVNGRLRVNPFEMRNSTGGGKKNVRILLGHKFGGSEDFVEFAPYCDYGHSFVHVQPAAAATALSSQNNGTNESNNIIDITYKNNNNNKDSRNGNQPVAHATVVPAAGDFASGHIASLENVKTMESDRATLDQLRQSFFNIKTGLKGVKGVIERFRQAIVRGR